MIKHTLVAAAALSALTLGACQPAAAGKSDAPAEGSMASADSMAPAGEAMAPADKMAADEKMVPTEGSMAPAGDAMAPADKMAPAH